MNPLTCVKITPRNRFSVYVKTRNRQNRGCQHLNGDSPRRGNFCTRTRALINSGYYNLYGIYSSGDALAQEFQFFYPRTLLSLAWEPVSYRPRLHARLKKEARREPRKEVPFDEAQTLYLIFGSERRGNGEIPARNEPEERMIEDPVNKIATVCCQMIHCSVLDLLRYPSSRN